MAHIIAGQAAEPDIGFKINVQTGYDMTTLKGILGSTFALGAAAFAVHALQAQPRLH